MENFETDPNSKFMFNEFPSRKSILPTLQKPPVSLQEGDQLVTEKNYETIQIVSHHKVNPIAASKINWSDYDWPICCKIIHYNLNEVHPKLRPTFTTLYINFFFFTVVVFIKCVCHFFLFPKNELNIIFVLTLCPVLLILKIQNFYSAYRGLFYDDSFKIVFKITSVLFIAFSLVNIGLGEFIFDGIPRLLVYSEEVPVNVFIMFMLILEFSVNGLFAILEIIAFTMFLVYEKKYDN
jgi:hypothetical protein